MDNIVKEQTMSDKTFNFIRFLAEIGITAVGVPLVNFKFLYIRNATVY